MSNQIKTGYFVGDNGLIYLPIGFVPEYFKLVAMAATNPNIYEWFRLMEQKADAAGDEGIIMTGSSGILTYGAASALIAAYDSGTNGPTVTTWSAGLTVVAKTSTAHGTYVRPTQGSSADMSAIFEVVTNTITGATEPTWPDAIGEQVSDNHASPVVYERVNVALTKVGYQGIRVAASIVGDGITAYYLALQADNSVDHGDVEGWTGGIEGA